MQTESEFAPKVYNVYNYVIEETWGQLIKHTSRFFAQVTLPYQVQDTIF